jgi:DNA-binding transcriptional MerR regulator
VKIGEIATRAGIPARTIRFWEEKDLLPEPDRTPAGYRSYDSDILERLAFIRHAQVAGLTLEQIRQVLDIRSNGEPPSVHVTEAIAQRLAEVESRIAKLKLLVASWNARTRRDERPRPCHRDPTPPTNTVGPFGTPTGRALRKDPSLLTHPPVSKRF